MSFHFARVPLLAWLLWAASGCGSTPLPAVIAQDSSAPDAGGAGSAGIVGGAGAGTDAGVCSALAEGRYVLRSRSNGQCLGQGASTTVLGTRAFVTGFDPDCRLPAQSWDLIAVDNTGVFTIRNVLSEFVLDVRTGDMADGTPVITYPSLGRDNQRFAVRARDAYGYELRPQHSTGSCVTAAALSAEIDACQPSLPVQEWLLQRSDCL
ncbi:MAG: RICIN domain-containing protein [Polyangiaceae bacterium]